MQFQDYFPSFSEALATIYSKEESRFARGSTLKKDYFQANIAVNSKKMRNFGS